MRQPGELLEATAADQFTISVIISTAPAVVSTRRIQK